MRKTALITLYPCFLYKKKGTAILAATTQAAYVPKNQHTNMGLHTHQIAHLNINIPYARMQVFIPYRWNRPLCSPNLHFQAYHSLFAELFIWKMLHNIYFLFDQIYIYIVTILIIGV